MSDPADNGKAAMSDPAESTTARTAFEAYREAVGGRTHTDEPIPPWDELSSRTQEGWRSAAWAGWQSHADAARAQALGAARQMVDQEGANGPTARLAEAFANASGRLAPDVAAGWDDIDPGQQRMLREVFADLTRGGHLHAGRAERAYRSRNDDYVPPKLRPEHHSGIVAEVNPGATRSWWDLDAAENLLNGAWAIIGTLVDDTFNWDVDSSMRWRAAAARWRDRYQDSVVARRPPTMARVELAGADESNGGEHAHWFWADVSGDGTHWSHFQGHQMQVDVELHTYNEREQNDWKGRDEIRPSGEWTLRLNRQQMGHDYIGNDVGAVLRRLDRLIEELRNHHALDHRIAVPYREQLVGRKVYYDVAPATVTALTGDGCVMLHVVGAEHFPPSAYEVDGDKMREPESEIKVELTSPRIWWWRDTLAEGEPATQADWVAAERERTAEVEATYRTRVETWNALVTPTPVMAADDVTRPKVEIEVTPDEDPEGADAPGAREREL